MGSALPKWIGGFTTMLQYKGFDFTAILAYQIGGKFFSVEYANHLYRSGNIGNALSAELLGNTWTPENKDAKFPMTFYGMTGIQQVLLMAPGSTAICPCLMHLT